MGAPCLGLVQSCPSEHPPHSPPGLPCEMEASLLSENLDSPPLSPPVLGGALLRSPLWAGHVHLFPVPPLSKAGRKGRLGRGLRSSGGHRTWGPGGSPSDWVGMGSQEFIMRSVGLVVHLEGWCTQASTWEPQTANQYMGEPMRVGVEAKVHS